jgi:hypothetical protein
MIGAFAASCFPTPQKVLDFSADVRTYQPSDYPKIQKAWTRHTPFIKYDIGSVFEGWATLKGPEFRQAYVAKYASVYGLAQNEQEALLKAQTQVEQSGYEIHLIAQSTYDKWIDFDKRTSPWRISLVDGTGAEISPTSVRAENYPDIYESVFFPDRTPFSRSFTIKFLKPEPSEGFIGPTSGRLILRIASPIARIEFVWQSQSHHKGAR